jgi:sterol desaturase/sphingolipid hydroxylase (fatty acid hydroxylase superfamily)
VTEPTLLSSVLSTAGGILAAMAVLALVETVVPLHARGVWNRRHLGPNLALTFITFATNALYNMAVVLALVWMEASGAGLLRAWAPPPVLATALVVLTLDFAAWVAHVWMHASPLLWRFHAVHHSDRAVDVSTTVRQHPGEGVVRYLFTAAAALGVGASPGAFALYRVWSALHAVLEHSNVRVPPRLDSLVSGVFATPNMHKVHHSRRKEESNTNYGNIFSLFDRLFSTFTPSTRGLSIVYGLDGFDDGAVQTTAGLLTVPFRAARFSRRVRALPGADPAC